MRSIRTKRVVVFGLALGALLATAAVGQEKKKPAPPPPTMTTAESKTADSKTVEHLIEATAIVQAIDLAHREVTLKGPEGNVETIMVPPEVRRITDIHVGDEVTVQYYIGVAAELRAPTDEEKKEPYKVMEDSARAPKTSAPAGMKSQVIRVVATIDKIDAAQNTVTLKGPKGKFHTVQVEDPAVIQRVKVGDTVVVTVAEALAVSLEPAKKGEKGK
jgi:hypothetical protein